MRPKFFVTPDAWRQWLEENHSREKELLVGFYKKGSGHPSIDWPQSVDAALCFGWIDGVRRRIDDASYSIRFTPRKPRSIWSAVNIKRVEELGTEGLMHAAGMAAFQLRKDATSVVYAYEQKNVEWGPEQLLRFQANEKAWNFFQHRPPWYRRTATWRVLSAKREVTIEKRLSTLIADSEEGRTIAQLTRKEPEMD